MARFFCLPLSQCRKTSGQILCWASHIHYLFFKQIYDVIIISPFHRYGHWRKIMELSPGQVVNIPYGAELRAQEFLIPDPVLFPV